MEVSENTAGRRLCLFLCFWFKGGTHFHSEWFSKRGPAAPPTHGVLVQIHIPAPPPTGPPTLVIWVNKPLGEIPMSLQFEHHSSTLLCEDRWGPGDGRRRWSCLERDILAPCVCRGLRDRGPLGPVLVKDKRGCHCLWRGRKADAPTSLWGGKGLCFRTPCRWCLARVAIAKLGFASAKVRPGHWSTRKRLPCGDDFPDLSPHWAVF